MTSRFARRIGHRGLPAALAVGLAGCLSLPAGPGPAPVAAATPAAPAEPAGGFDRPDLPPRPEAIAFPPLEAALPRPERVVLSSGLVALLLPDRSLPLVHLELRVRAGSALDPPGRSGLAALVARCLRAGGAGDRAPPAIDLALDEMACELEFQVGQDAAQVSLDVPAEHWPRALALLAEVLRRPRFDPERFAVQREAAAREQTLALESPERTAAWVFRQALYGTHPYGRPVQGRPADLRAIEREALVEFHRRCWRPEGAVLGLAGDFERDEALGRLQDALVAWVGGGPPPGPLPEVPESAPGRRCLVVDRPGLAQCTVWMGHLGPRHRDPEEAPRRILNDVLGGGTFSSRLGLRVRSDEGLAYGVWSAFEPRDQRGEFVAVCQTRREAAVRAAAIVAEEVARMAGAEPAADEMRQAREAAVGSQAALGARGDTYISELVDLAYAGHPDGHLDVLRRDLAAVEAADVRAAAGRWLFPGRLLVVVVGLPPEGPEALSALGPVQVVPDPLAGP